MRKHGLGMEVEQERQPKVEQEIEQKVDQEVEQDLKQGVKQQEGARRWIEMLGSRSGGWKGKEERKKCRRGGKSEVETGGKTVNGAEDQKHYKIISSSMLALTWQETIQREHPLSLKGHQRQGIPQSLGSHC